MKMSQRKTPNNLLFMLCILLILFGGAVYYKYSYQDVVSAAQIKPGLPLQLMKVKALSNDIMPKLRDPASLDRIAQRVDGRGVFSDVEMLVNIPQPETIGGISSQDIGRISLNIHGSKGNLPIIIDASDSYLTATKFNGEILVHGPLTGKLIYGDGMSVDCTISIAAIPSLRQSYLSIIVDNTKMGDPNYKPMYHVVFGNLPITPELINVISPSE